jgi:hypothetical protein
MRIPASCDVNVYNKTSMLKEHRGTVVTVSTTHIAENVGQFLQSLIKGP